MIFRIVIIIPPKTIIEIRIGITDMAEIAETIEMVETIEIVEVMDKEDYKAIIKIDLNTN